MRLLKRAISYLENKFWVPGDGGDCVYIYAPRRVHSCIKAMSTSWDVNLYFGATEEETVFFFSEDELIKKSSTRFHEILSAIYELRKEEAMRRVPSTSTRILLNVPLFPEAVAELNARLDEENAIKLTPGA